MNLKRLNGFKDIYMEIQMNLKKFKWI